MKPIMTHELPAVIVTGGKGERFKKMTGDITPKEFDEALLAAGGRAIDRRGVPGTFISASELDTAKAKPAEIKPQPENGPKKGRPRKDAAALRPDE